MHGTFGGCLLNKLFRFLPNARWMFLMGLLAAVPSTSYATLVFVGSATSNGGGIGTSNVILTIQNTGTEQGCVAWNGTADVIGSAACPAGLNPAIVGGNEKTGNSQTQTRTITQTGVLSSSSMTVILNVNEPAGGTFTVNNISVTIYSAAGTILYNSGNLLNNPISVVNSFQGQGNPGFAFQLDSTSAAAAASYFANGTNRIGIAGLLTGTSGSNETFSVADASVLTITGPEPSSALLSVAGFGGLAFFAFISPARKRNRKD